MRDHAHEMIDQLDPTQLAAIVHMLEVFTDPVVRSLAKAQFDAEPNSAAEAAELDEAHAAIQRGEGIAHEDMLHEFGISR